MRIRVLVVALLLLAVPAVAAAYDRLVNPFHSCSLSGVPEYDTLQDAVDAANPGDQIGVCPGTYSQNVSVDVNKPGLTLTGIGSVLISPSPPGSPGSSCFGIGAPGVTVRYFVVQHCDTGISVAPGGSGALIQNNTLQSNRLGVTIDGPNVIVQNNLFEGNDEGVVALSNTDGTTIKNNTVRGGTIGIELSGTTGIVVNKNAVQGASVVGIFAADTIDSTISFNSVSSNGIGIQLGIVGSGNQVTRNVVTKDTDIDCAWSGIGGVTFSRNTCGTELPAGAWD